MDTKNLTAEELTQWIDRLTNCTAPDDLRVYADICNALQVLRHIQKELTDAIPLP